MASQGNLGRTYNEMFRTPNLLKHQITGGAVEELSKLKAMLSTTKEEIDSLEAKTPKCSYIPNKYVIGKPVGIKTKPVILADEIEFVTISQLSKALKWHYNDIRGASYLEQFNNVVQRTHKGLAVKIEDVPEFCEILYKFMGENK